MSAIVKNLKQDVIVWRHMFEQALEDSLNNLTNKLGAKIFGLEKRVGKPKSALFNFANLTD